MYKIKGIAGAIVEISNYYRDPCFDVRYNHAEVNFYREKDLENGFRDCQFTISFQRHSLVDMSRQGSTIGTRIEEIDPRWDWGLVAWSPFYAGHIKANIELGYGWQKLSVLEKFYNKQRDVDVPSNHKQYDCLSNLLEKMEALKIPFDIRYRNNGPEVPRNTLTGTPARDFLTHYRINKEKDLQNGE